MCWAVETLLSPINPPLVYELCWQSRPDPSIHCPVHPFCCQLLVIWRIPILSRHNNNNQLTAPSLRRCFRFAMSPTMHQNDMMDQDPVASLTRSPRERPNRVHKHHRRTSSGSRTWTEEEVTRLQGDTKEQHRSDPPKRKTTLSALGSIRCHTSTLQRI